MYGEGALGEALVGGGGGGGVGFDVDVEEEVL